MTTTVLPPQATEDPELVTASRAARPGSPAQRDGAQWDGAGDARFDAFFREHHRAVYGFACQILTDPTDADDVTSDVLVAVYLKWQRGRVDDPRAYLRRAVVNRVTSGFRKLAVQRRYVAAQLPPGDPRHQGAFDERLAQSDQLRRALARLPVRQRAAIVLRFYEDLSEADTAAALGCSVGTVKSQVHHGVARLRTLLASHLSEGEAAP